MIKRMAIFLLVITAIPTIMLSLPVWADADKTDLAMTVKLTGTPFLGSVKVWEYQTSRGIAGYYNQDIKDGWTETLGAQEREETMYISVAANDQSDVYCKIKGTNDSAIPLMDETGKPISALTLEVTEASAKVSTCALVLGEEVPAEQKLLNIFVLESSLTSPFTLTMNHYDANKQVIGSPVTLSVPAGGDEDFLQNVVPNAANYSTISYGTTSCVYESGSDPSFIYAPVAGSSAKVYVEVQENSCVLDPAAAPPPPNGQAITTCVELQNIKSNLAGDYYLANNLSNCNHVTITGVFTGSLNGNHMSISNIAITKNSGTGESGPDVALFQEIGSGGEVYDMIVNTATLSGETDGLKALIAAFTTSAKISNIKVNNITIKDGTKNNATGSIVGRSSGVEGAPTLLTNVHVNGANIKRNGYAGGLIGRAWSWTTIDKSSVRGFTSGDGNGDCSSDQENCAIGGLIGAVTDTGDDYFVVKINESSAKGTIATEYNAGGLIGYIGETKKVVFDISDSYAIVDVTSLNEHAGGLIGRAVEAGSNNIQLNYTYAAGWIKDEDATQGIIGKENGKSSARIYSPSNSSLWDYQASGHTVSGDRVSESESTQIMKAGIATEAPFNSKWNTNIWKFVPGQYPSLMSDPENNP